MRIEDYFIKPSIYMLIGPALLANGMHCSVYPLSDSNLRWQEVL